MHEEEWTFGSIFSLRAHMQQQVDQILLAVAGRLWELRRDTALRGCSSTEAPQHVEAMRESPLGQCLLLIACYVEQPYWGFKQAQVEQAMQRVLRSVFGNPFEEGYTLPAKFHTTELGKLFHEAYAKMYSSNDLLTVKQAAQVAGVARQSVYDRIDDGKLHPIYYYQEQRLLRSEVEEWKAQRSRQNTH